MARFFYTCFFYLLVPFILLRLLWRSRQAPDYKKRWSERFGFFPKPKLKSKVIWIHAVSVGESLAAVPLIQHFLKHIKNTSLVVTTTTPTGSDRITHRFGHLADKDLFHVYCPYDLPDCLWRFFRQIKPNAFIVMETELWPNAIAACKKRKVPVVLANGRLSEKSAKGYAKIDWLIRPVFESINAAAVQAQTDAERMQSLGLGRDRCSVTGSIKFDLKLDQETRAKAQELVEHIQSPTTSKVLIAASTHESEEVIVLDAFRIIQDYIKDSFLIIVPRHPERFGAVADLIKAKGFSFNRRHNNRLEIGSNILLGDTMGELLVLLGAADTAFIGGSLVPVGGHNLMEPAAWGLPILTGPHLHNFVEASKLLQEAGALEIVDSAETLAEKTIALWQDDNKRKAVGESALAVANHNRGALDKLIDVIEKTI